MFEIFGALFGGAYLMYKVGSDNARKQESEARYNKYRQIQQRVTNSDLEWKMRTKMSFKYRDSTEKIMKALSERDKMVSEVSEKDMEYVFGSDWRELFAQKPLPYLADQLPSYTPECFHYIHEVAFNLWMSQKGYIVGDHCAKGYSAKCIITGLPDEQQGRRYGITDRAVEVILRNVQKYHPECRLEQDPIKPGLKSWSFWVDVWR